MTAPPSEPNNDSRRRDIHDLANRADQVLDELSEVIQMMAELLRERAEPDDGDAPAEA